MIAARHERPRPSPRPTAHERSCCYSSSAARRRQPLAASAATASPSSATTRARRRAAVNASWRVRQHARARLEAHAALPSSSAGTSVPLYADSIWGCGRRSPAARQWQRREWILCGAKPLPNSVVVPGRTHLGVDLFSPTFQHEMINGVQQLAGVWPRFVNDTKSQLLCHGFTCAWRGGAELVAVHRGKKVPALLEARAGGRAREGRFVVAGRVRPVRGPLHCGTPRGHTAGTAPHHSLRVAQPRPTTASASS